MSQHTFPGTRKQQSNNLLTMLKKNYIETINSYYVYSGYAEQYFNELVVPTLRQIDGYSETEYLDANFNADNVVLMYMRISDDPEYNDLSFYTEIAIDKFLEYVERNEDAKR